MHYFLGIKVILIHNGLYISQHQNIHNLLDHTNMLMAKSVSRPMSTSSKHTPTTGHSLSNVTLYRNIIGSLQYVALTCSNTSFVVDCQYTQSPRIEHWKAVKYILKYLKLTISFGLLIRRGSTTTLNAFLDVD